MWPESSGRMEMDDATRPGDDDWPGDAADEADPDWPDGDAADEADPDWPDDWPDEGGNDPPWRRAAPPGAYGQAGGPQRRRLRPLALAAVAVVALAVGGGVALVITKRIDNLVSPSAVPSSQPSVAAPGGNSGSGAVPGGSGNGVAPGGGGVSGQAFIAGQVQKVSSTSITIGGGEQSMTAAVTSATKVTGKVTSIGAVKVGDDVSAQITVSGSGQATVTAIQDPAQAPSSGGGLP
jgi:hypothetical protein